MTMFWDSPIARPYGSSEQQVRTGRRFGGSAAILQTLRLWRERQRRRWELAMLSDRDLKDTGVPRDLVAHEARKWPWQAWHPQLQGFEEAARRRSLPRQ